MKYQDTTTFEKIEAMDARINICQGGSSSGKTISILMLLCDLSFEINNKTITVMSDTLPSLRRGAMKDWRELLRGTDREIYFEEKITEHTWTNRCTGTRIEFMACDDMGALGARREYLFVNEANRISYETFGQLEIRTFEKIWIDYNPSSKFWAMTEIMEKRSDWDFCKTTFEDNEALPQSVIDALLQRKGDGKNNFWRVYGLGEIGSLEGNVYEGWHSVPKIPEGFILKRYGVDFGWNDPTAVVAVYENDNNELLFDQILYQSKLPTAELVEKLGKLPPALMVCDSARPEIISDIRSAGIQAIGCDKSTKSPDGKIDNVLWGINLVQKRTCYYTQASKDLEREYLTYAWRKKKSGEVLDVPEDSNNHILDALRYCTLDLERKPIEYAAPR